MGDIIYNEAGLSRVRLWTTAKVYQATRAYYSRAPLLFMLFWRNKNRLYTEPKEKAHRVQYGGKGAYESARGLKHAERENKWRNKDKKSGGLNFTFCYF